MKTTQHSANTENETRAKRAEVALIAYNQTIGHYEPGDGLVDLLTDLRHWCRGRSSTFGFEEALERSESHFREENGDDTD
jgi:hypothetical protein